MNVVRGRAWKLLYAIMLIAVTGGCFAGTRPPSTTSGEGIIEIEVDWDVITAAGTDVTPLAVAPMALPANVTHVGARIEYPGQNAGFFQSVSREVASEQGIITMKVPPSKNANLYVAAVDSSTLSVVKLGYKRGLVILEDAVTTVKTDEITW